MRITDDGFSAQFKNAFSLKDPEKILNASLKTEDATQLIAWVESHDEYVTSNTHYSDVRVAKYWSIIASKKGLGGLYLARPTDELTVGQIGSYAFESEYVAISNRFHNRFYDAESYESADGTCYVVEKIKSGDQGVLILNLAEADTEKYVTVAVPHLEDGNYYDALTGKVAPVKDHKAYVQFDGSGMAVLTRSKDVHPQLEISERDCAFAGETEIVLTAKNADEAWWAVNGKDEKHSFADGKASVQLAGLVENGKVDLRVCLRKGVNVLDQTYTYTQVQLIPGRFNVLNLDEKYLNGDYELYIWSWSPGKWSKDYEIRDGVLLVDTAGMEGFLVAAFEKGYELPNPNAWDPNVLKQSTDIKGDILKAGFIDLSAF